MDSRKINQAFLYMNIFFAGINLLAIASGRANALTFLSLGFNILAAKVLRDALKG